VRDAVVAEQRRLLADGDWVAEGRDIGTVVAPGAEVKVFLTADPAERARRRAAELGASPEAVLADLARRDERDRTREHSPLVKADDAVEIDSTRMSLEDVVARIVARVRALDGD
jgi:cytidylate kinase